jgi:hypothetical protein
MERTSDRGRVKRFAAPEYAHTQRAPLCLMIYLPGVWSVAAGIVFGRGHNDPAALWIPVGVGLLLIVLASAFHHLTVEDEGDRLAIRFGPLPLFRRRVRYAEIQSVATGRTRWLDGWGIHFSPRGGWVWNLWGFDCVELKLNRHTLRIGSDDPHGLARFIAGKIGQPIETD